MNTFGAPSSDLPGPASTPEEISRFVTEAAMCAPSVHNTQPWWFSGPDRELSVHADGERRLPVADPDGREMLISCGAAVLTARVALRYLGFVPQVRLLPDPDVPTLVARISWPDQTAPPTDYERELYAEIPRRRTHRGGFDPEPVADEIVSALTGEAAKESAALEVLGDEARRAGLAAVVEAGDYALRRDTARAREEAKWARGPGSKRRDGVPASAYPAQPEKTEPHFPARDFSHGHGWGLPPADQGQVPRSAGVVALLTTTSDRREDWINAGQALQRVLLCASGCGVASALHSQPLEIIQLRDFISAQFCDGAHPQMIIRFGAAEQRAESMRLPISEVLL